MNDVATRVATAATFLWLGMVLAISFMEAPLKFRAPGIDLRLGLGIGRIVFRALNKAELGWAAILVLTLVVHPPPATGFVGAIVALGILAGQLGVLRPRLTRRTNRVLAGPDAPRSRVHHAYVVLESVKVIALVVLGAQLLAMLR